MNTMMSLLVFWSQPRCKGKRLSNNPWAHSLQWHDKNQGKLEEVEKQIAVCTPQRFAPLWEQSLWGGWKRSLRPGCPRTSLGDGKRDSFKGSCMQTSVVPLGLYQGPQKLSQQGGMCESHGSLWPGPSLCLPVLRPEKPNPENSSTGTQRSVLPWLESLRLASVQRNLYWMCQLML